MSQEQDDADFAEYKWMRDQRLPGAQEKIDELIARRVRERAEEEASLPDLPETIVIAVPPTRTRTVQYDPATGLFSGGSLDHNRPPEEFPGRDAL